MGKPYIAELGELSATLEWALTYDIQPLRQIVARSRALPLMAIGSGGSLTTANFLANIHTYYTGKAAFVSTPLEAISSKLNRKISVWLMSAGGRNADILAAFDKLVSQEPDQLSVMCGQPNSPLIIKSKKHRYVDLSEYFLPSGKDGFVATNSILAFCVLLLRAYANEYESSKNLIQKFGKIIKRLLKDDTVVKQWCGQFKPLWSKDTTIVLYGWDTKIGAVDLESKFTEAALGNVQLADFRNFAHGRHHWLAKRGNRSSIICLTSPEDSAIAEKTLALIPPEIPIARINFIGGHLISSIEALLAAFFIVGWTGSERGIDPGRPKVPTFGRKLYNLRPTRPKNPRIPISIADAIAIERKSGFPIEHLLKDGRFDHWRKALLAFKKKIQDTHFAAVVFDYDGTLVDARQRFSPPDNEIAEELLRLLKLNIAIGIATGRGKSVRSDLQKCIPKYLWDKVLVGYYNCSDIGLLSDNNCPDGTHEANESLSGIAQILRNDNELQSIAKQEDRPHQITIEPLGLVPENRIWDIACQLVASHNIRGIDILRSSHSIDIVAPGVSKLSIIEQLVDHYKIKKDECILKIGDRGRWPGNDYALLNQPYSLSVDELSVDPSTCWNLGSRGQRGVQVTLEYCRSLITRQGGGTNLVLNMGRKRG